MVLGFQYVYGSCYWVRINLSIGIFDVIFGLSIQSVLILVLRGFMLVLILTFSAKGIGY